MATAKQAAQPATLPQTVKIGVHVYAVTDDAGDWKDWEHEHKRSGYCGGSDHQKLKIVINPEMLLSQKQDTLLHECLHAAYYCSGLEASMKADHDDEQEVVIVTLTPWLHGLLMDNPELVRYVTWQP